MQKHHEDLRVLLNGRVDVGLLLLEVAHEHGGKVLVGQQPLTDSWEARVSHEGPELLQYLRGQSGRSEVGGATACTKIGLLVSISIIVAARILHCCHLCLARKSLQQNFEGKVRLVLRHGEGPDAVLTRLA